MKKLQATYKGYKGGAYLFKIDDRDIEFIKLRVGLIHEYSLKENTSIGQIFMISYFVSRESGKDVLILSDLSVPQKV